MEYGQRLSGRLLDGKSGGAMGWTEQQAALNQMQERYGDSGYTVDHLHYKMVGFFRPANKGRSSQRIFAIGNTWKEALRELERKAAA